MESKLQETRSTAKIITIVLESSTNSYFYCFCHIMIINNEHQLIHIYDK